jgi:outer membrane protein TolC
MNARLFVPLVLLSSSAAAESRILTVEDAVKLAIDGNPRVKAARSRADAANDQADSIRGHYLPAIALSEEWQHYNSPFSIPFNFSIPNVPFTIPPVAFPVREINTNSFAIAADQPLLGLLHIGEDHAAAQDRGRASAEQEKVTEDAIREEVQTQFLRLFEARATEDIARTSQAQLNEELTVTESRLTAGVATNADVLRTKVAVANARQQEIQAQAQEQVARAALLADLNEPATDTSLDFAEPTSLENAPAPPALQDAVTKAEHSRPELAGARYVQSAADHSHLASIFKLLPEVDLEAAYVNISGQVFAEKNSEFVGIKASWPIWEWGADYYAQRAAGNQALAASFDTENTRALVDQDLSSKLSIEKAASVAVDVAQTTIASAEEAFRVTDALVKAGSATTTDLLDSQSALTQAKLNLVRARYEQAIARVSVKRAMGER